MAAFCSSKGAFGGKTIVQPPGGHYSLQTLLLDCVDRDVDAHCLFCKILPVFETKFS
jgi:hypothetical protein